jgi:hypothetical protein
VLLEVCGGWLGPLAGRGVDHQRRIEIARQALEPRSQVHSVADRRPDHAIHCLDVPHEGLARGDTHADREHGLSTVVVLDGHRFHRRDHLAPCLHRGAGVS